MGDLVSRYGWLLVLALAAIFGLAMALAMIAGLIDPFGLGQRYLIEAGQVTGDRKSGINGSFRIVQTQPIMIYENAYKFYPGIVSERYGGACLIFPADDLGFTTMDAGQCYSNADCSNPDPTAAPGTEAYGVYTPDSNNPGHLENRWGYCDVATHKCWSKPIYMDGIFSKTNSVGAQAALCRLKIKSPPFNDSPWPENADNPLSVSPSDLSGFGLFPGAVNARVVACLQGSNATKETGCSSVNGPDRIEVLGPVESVNP